MNKTELRKVFKENRRGLSPGQLSALSEDIIERLLATFQLEKKTVSLFLPIERQKEINTYSLWEKIRSFEGNEIKFSHKSCKSLLLVTEAVHVLA